MEEKDIEKLLKENAEGIKIKDFSERWRDISARISSQQDVALKELTNETVLATSANGNASNKRVRAKIIYSISAVFLLIVICLAIVLPIALKKNDGRQYFNLNELTNEIVSKNEFYNKLEETDLELINFENFAVDNFEADNYVLLYTSENKLVGGKLVITDEIDWVYSEIVFCDTTITSSFDIGTDYKSCDINGVSIIYKAELTGEYYTIKVKAVNNNTVYELECFALNENIESFFEKIFG